MSWTSTIPIGTEVRFISCWSGMGVRPLVGTKATVIEPDKDWQETYGEEYPDRVWVRVSLQQKHGYEGLVEEHGVRDMGGGVWILNAYDWDDPDRNCFRFACPAACVQLAREEYLLEGHEDALAKAWRAEVKRDADWYFAESDRLRAEEEAAHNRVLEANTSETLAGLRTAMRACDTHHKKSFQPNWDNCLRAVGLLE